MKHNLHLSEPKLHLFFSKLVREMAESAQSIGITINHAAVEDYFGADEHESITRDLDILRSNIDEAFLLCRVRDNSLLPPNCRWAIPGARALVTRVNRFTSEKDTEGLLRFVGFNNAGKGDPA